MGFEIPSYFIVAASSWISRVITTAISLISVRIILNAIGVENYAAYVVVMGVIGWFSLADIGMGLSLQNYISEARSGNKPYTNHIYAASKIVLLVVSLLAVILVLFGMLPASWLLSQFSTISFQEKYLALVTVGCLVAFSAWGALIYRIWYAEHKGYLANITTALASVVGLILILVINNSEINNKLLWFLIAVNLPFAVFPAISLLIRLIKEPRNSPIRKINLAKKISRRGMGFWIFNLVAAFVMQVDYIILSQLVESHQIVTYFIVSKIFAIAGFLFSAIHQAFWPVCSEAIIRDDWNLVKGFIKQYMKWGLILLFVFTVLVSIYIGTITEIISPRDKVDISYNLIFLFGIMFAIRLWTDIFAVILQSMNNLKALIYWAIVQASVGLILQLILVPIYGIYGTVIALTLSWVLTVAWALPRMVYIIQKNQSVVENI